MHWTKRKIAALIALLAGGVTGGVLVTRDDPDRAPPAATTRVTAQEGTTRAQRREEARATERPSRSRARARRSRTRSARRRPARSNTRLIRWGDTLWEIASDQLGDDASAPHVARRVRRLAALNDLDDPDLILAGSRLRVRG